MRNTNSSSNLHRYADNYWDTKKERGRVVTEKQEQNTQREREREKEGEGRRNSRTADNESALLVNKNG